MASDNLRSTYSVNLIKSIGTDNYTMYSYISTINDLLAKNRLDFSNDLIVGVFQHFYKQLITRSDNNITLNVLSRNDISVMMKQLVSTDKINPNYQYYKDIMNARSIKNELIKTIKDVNPSFSMLEREFALERMASAYFRNPTSYKPDIIVDEIHKYLASLKFNVRKNEIKNKLVDLRKSNPTTMNIINNMIDEQFAYINNPDKDCLTYYVNVTINDYQYGGVFVFYNSKLKEPQSNDTYIFLQGIVKYTIPYLTGLLFPNINKELPRLNEIVNIAIQSMTKSLNTPYIYVKPIHKQFNILKKYYGYKELDVKYTYPSSGLSLDRRSQGHARPGPKIEYPCSQIKRSSEWEPVLYKRVNIGISIVQPSEPNIIVIH